MSDDIWHGGDCETRIGRRPDRETAPLSWSAAEFLTLTVTPTQERRERNKLGNPGIRKNPLDPTRSRKGFFRLGAELALDADTRQLGVWLAAGMGGGLAPTENADDPDLFDHVFESGSKAERYFDIVVKVGDADFRLYEGLTLAQLSTQFTGENTQDFNINISLQGMRRKKLAAWPAGAVAAIPDEGPVLRTLFTVDGVPASNMLGGSFSFGRALQEGIFLSPTPTISSLRPNGAQHAGSANYRAIGADFDVMEEEEATFAAAFDMLGVVEGHMIRLEHPQGQLSPSPLAITGTGAIERTINWTPYQTAAAAAARITLTNDVETYA
jgi:hypothetical protein